MSEMNREFHFTREDFDFLRKLSNEHSGILVPDDKFDMFYSRLSKRLRLLGFTDFRQYCKYLKNNPDQEFTEFINAVTTNLTSFFREKHHFDYLESVVIPEILKRNALNKKVRIWSAGCSTGEEPYSLAITLKRKIPTDWDVRILATDLDTNVLQVAAQGVYMDDRIAGLPSEIVKNWFKKGKGHNMRKVRVHPDLQSIITFRQLNLIKDWPFHKPFDCIFCRNVLIYFDRQTKQNLAQRYSQLLASGSRLFIGHSESLHQLNTDFELIGNTIYRKK